MQSSEGEGNLFIKWCWNVLEQLYTDEQKKRTLTEVLSYIKIKSKLSLSYETVKSSEISLRDIVGYRQS